MFNAMLKRLVLSAFCLALIAGLLDGCGQKSAKAERIALNGADVPNHSAVNINKKPGQDIEGLADYISVEIITNGSFVTNSVSVFGKLETAKDNYQALRNQIISLNKQIREVNGLGDEGFLYPKNPYNIIFRNGKYLVAVSSYSQEDGLKYAALVDSRIK